MEAKNEYIEIKYKLVKNFCECCNQQLPKEKVKEWYFNFSKKGFEEWGGYDEMEYLESDDLDVLIEEYATETIRFFSVSSEGIIKFEVGELEKLKNFITKKEG